MTVEERIEALEMKVTYTEDLLQSLNDAVVAQQQRLEQATQQMSALVARIESLSGAPPIIDEKPPHY